MAVVGGWHWEEELKRVRYRSGYGQRRAGGLNERSGERGRGKKISGKLNFLKSAT